MTLAHLRFGQLDLNYVPGVKGFTKFRNRLTNFVHLKFDSSRTSVKKITNKRKVGEIALIMFHATFWRVNYFPFLSYNENYLAL